MNDEEMSWKKGVQYLDESVTPDELKSRTAAAAKRAREFKNRMKAIAEPLVRNYNASKRNSK